MTSRKKSTSKERKEFALLFAELAYKVYKDKKQFDTKVKKSGKEE